MTTKSTIQKNQNKSGSQKKKKGNGKGKTPKDARGLKRAIAVQQRLSETQECVLRYLLARLDPFDSDAVGACYPGSGSLPSWKITTRSRGSFKSNSAPSIAAIKYRPTPFSDLPCVRYTDGSAVVSTWPMAHTAATAGVTESNPLGANLVSTSMGDKLRWRLVAAGIRVRTSGPSLYRGGVIYGYTNPGGVLAESTIDQVPIAPSYRSVKFKEAASGGTLTVLTNLPPGYEGVYANYSKWFDGSTDNGYCSSYIFTDPAEHTTNDYFYETVEHWEIIGSDVQYLASPTPSDPISADIASVVGTTVAVNSDGSRSNQTRISQGFQQFAEEIGSGMTSLSNGAMSAMGTIATGASLLKALRTGVHVMGRAAPLMLTA